MSTTFPPPTFPPTNATTATTMTTIVNVTNATTTPYHIVIDERSDMFKMSENGLVGLIAGIAGFIVMCIAVAVLVLYCRSKQGSATFGNSCIGRWCCCCRCLWESQVHTASSFYRRRHRSQRSEGAGDELYGPRDIEVVVTCPQHSGTYEEELAWIPSHQERQSRKRPPSTERDSPQESPGLEPTERHVLDNHSFSRVGTVEDDISSTSNPVQSVNSLNADECQRGAVLPQVHTDPSALVGRVVAQSGPTDPIALWADDQLKHMGTHDE